MLGMLQIITYLLAFYLIVKSLEINMIAMCSREPGRTPRIMWSIALVAICTLAAGVFVLLQDSQAESIARGLREGLRDAWR